MASASDRVEPGMFHTIQCSTSSVPLPIAASVSRVMSTKLCTPSGTLLHASGGDTCAPACVYFAGIIPPSVQAVVVSDSTCIGERRPCPPGAPCGGFAGGSGFGSPVFGACCACFHAS